MNVYRTVVAGADGSESPRAVAGSPVEALLDVVGPASAGPLVVGNRWSNSVTGRLPGPVPAVATSPSACDVLVVQATG